MLLTALLAAGCVTAPDLAQAPKAIVDRFDFLVRNDQFVPIRDAVVEFRFVAGRPIGPSRIKTDRRGLARLTVSPTVRYQVSPGTTDDRLYDYDSTIEYVVRAPGYLPVSGRARLTDAWQHFSRAEFAATMNRTPKNKRLLLTPVLTKVSDILAEGTDQTPDGRLVAAGIDRLWRIWEAAKTAEPAANSWELVDEDGLTRLRGAIILPLEAGVGGDGDIYRIFTSNFLPFLADVRAVYGPLVQGWDLSVQVRAKTADPHALPQIATLRLVFSEQARQEAGQGPGGLNRLLMSAETIEFGGKPWQPLTRLDEGQEEAEFNWRWLAPLAAPTLE